MWCVVLTTRTQTLLPENRKSPVSFYSRKHDEPRYESNDKRQQGYLATLFLIYFKIKTPRLTSLTSVSR